MPQHYYALLVLLLLCVHVLQPTMPHSLAQWW
jgi:hypothetical protein